MPTKRQILDTLKLTELQDLASTFELLVGDRRVREHLVEAAGLSHRVSIEQVLGGLPRERLKEICRELGLPDHGKEKASIVARILGREPEQGSFNLAPSDSASPPPPPPSQKPAKTSQPSPSQKTPKPTPRGDSGSDLGFESKLWHRSRQSVIECPLSSPDRAPVHMMTSRALVPKPRLDFLSAKNHPV